MHDHFRKNILFILLPIFFSRVVQARPSCCGFSTHVEGAVCVLAEFGKETADHLSYCQLTSSARLPDTHLEVDASSHNGPHPGTALLVALDSLEINGHLVVQYNFPATYGEYLLINSFGPLSGEFRSVTLRFSDGKEYSDKPIIDKHSIYIRYEGFLDPLFRSPISLTVWSLITCLCGFVLCSGAVYVMHRNGTKFNFLSLTLSPSRTSESTSLLLDDTTLKSEKDDTESRFVQQQGYDAVITLPTVGAYSCENVLRQVTSALLARIDDDGYSYGENDSCVALELSPFSLIARNSEVFSLENMCKKLNSLCANDAAAKLLQICEGVSQLHRKKCSWDPSSVVFQDGSWKVLPYLGALRDLVGRRGIDCGSIPDKWKPQGYSKSLYNFRESYRRQDIHVLLEFIKSVKSIPEGIKKGLPCMSNEAIDMDTVMKTITESLRERFP